MKLSEIVNKSNKWIFCNNKLSRFLVFNSDLTISKKNFYISFELILIILFSFFIILLFYLWQYLFFLKKQNLIKKYIILKVNEGHDEKNIFKLLDIQEEETIKISAFNKFDYMKVQNVGLIKLLKNYLININELHKIYQYQFSNNLRTLIFTNCTNNLAHFSYLSTFFEECKNKNKNIAVLTSGSYLSANAAISEGICTHLYLHGNLGKFSPIVLPLFDYIYVYSIEEKKYFKDLNIKSEVQVYPYEKILSHKNIVIFFMRVMDESMNEKLIINLLKVFQRYNYEIYFKNHPSYSGKMTYKLSKLFDIKIIDSKLYDGYSIIKTKKPRFIVSWFSTAISESSNSGVIPITLADPTEMQNKNKDINKPPIIIFPIHKRSLCWPSESKIVFDLLNSKVEYKSILKKLKLR